MGTTGLQLSADVPQQMSFAPQFEITNSITAELTRIERARGFLDAAKLSEDWITGMQKRALVLEAHYTTHIEGTQLTLEQSERILAGQKVRGARPDDAQELLNYKKAFELVSGYLESGEPIAEALIRRFTNASFKACAETRRHRENIAKFKITSSTCAQERRHIRRHHH
jgi:Fic family protein